MLALWGCGRKLVTTQERASADTPKWPLSGLQAVHAVGI